MSEQLFLEAFNSEPYFFEKEEKYGAMDIIYTFEDEAGHGFKFHFEKKVALGKHAYVCVLSQKTPGLKTYKRVIGKFSNPMRTVATLLAVVRDIHDTRKDVHGIVMSIPEQAFGSYSRLVKKIMTRELRTVLNVEDGEYTPEDFEKMGLVGIVTTVKPRNMNTVYTGPALKEYQERQAGKDGAGVSAPAAVKKPKQTSVISKESTLEIETRYDGVFQSGNAFRVTVHGVEENGGKGVINIFKKNGFSYLSDSLNRLIFSYPGESAPNIDSDLARVVNEINASTNFEAIIGKRYVGINHAFKYDGRAYAMFSSPRELKVAHAIVLSAGIKGLELYNEPGKYHLIDSSGKMTSKEFSDLLTPLFGEGRIISDRPADEPKQTSVAQTMPVEDPNVYRKLEVNILRTNVENSVRFEIVNRFSRAEMHDGEELIVKLHSSILSTLAKLMQVVPGFIMRQVILGESGEVELSFESKYLPKILELIKKTVGNKARFVGLERLEDLVPKQPVVDPVAEKENFYFDYDHRQITLTFDNAETAGRIKDQLLELGAATFNGNEFFTDKEKLILLDDKSLDVKKVQATLFPILGQPVSMNGVFVDPNVTTSVRSPDGVTYKIKGNTIQVEDAPKDSAMSIVRTLIPMADRIFDDKGSNTLELNEQGIADGFTMHNIAPTFKKSNISSRLSAKLFRSWESAVTEASNKYDLSTGDLGSSFTNNSSYLIDAATSGVEGEYIRTAGNVISGIVLKSNYKIREAVAKPLVALGFTVEYDVQGWKTQVKLPVNSDYTIPGTSELAVFIKEVDNLANIARNRQIVEYVGGNKNFKARWNPDGSRAFLILPTAESSGLGWRDYTAYATAPEYVRVDNIGSYEEFLKLTEFAKNFDFGANLLRNIGVSKYLSDVRSGGATASKSYKLKDGGEVEISFKFGDKVTIIFNQNSEGFDKEMSEFVSEKMEISGRASAIPLYMLGTADANKTLKNIDAWLDAHIVSKEDNSSKGNGKASVGATPKPKPKLFNDLTIKLKKQGNLPQLTINVKGDDVFITQLAPSGMHQTESRDLAFLMDSNPAYGSVASKNAEVKRRLLQLVGATKSRIESEISSWTGGYQKVESISGNIGTEASKVSVPPTAPKSKNIVKPLISAIESVSKDGKEKKVTGFDLRVGETWAYDGQRGEMGNLLFISGPESASLDSKIRSLGGAVLLRGVTRVGDLTIEFEDVAKRRKSKLTFTCGGLVQGSFESLKGSFSPATKSKVDKLISKMFTDSPQAIANEFADFIGNPDLRYKIVKDARKPAILISKNPAGFKEALADAELLLESQLDEGIKEDLTGKAPNRVKRELLEATLKKLGLYRESFSYGNASFKTVMTECAVEIIPTSGNIRNFAKMLGARLGQELRIDDEGFLSFDLDNI